MDKEHTQNTRNLKEIERLQYNVDDEKTLNDSQIITRMRKSINCGFRWIVVIWMTKKEVETAK